MTTTTTRRIGAAVVLCVSAACSSGGLSTTDMGSPTDLAGGGGSCALTANTSATSTVASSGCAVLDRDTSACRAARTAAGLSGFWLQFSCRVTLSKVSQNGADYVKADSDDQPDTLSNYFPSANPCHESYTAAIQNPNTIAAQSLSVYFPLAPGGTGGRMTTAVVGLALNGVAIFGNFAAPGDDIFQEARTFDRCAAHPQMSGVYHYHSEPLSISNDDARFIGVMRDGYPIYGRRDANGSIPTLDSFGGHTDTTPDSPSTAVYHYHVNQQTSVSSGTAGEMQWFLTKGQYKGAPAATCTGCN